MCEESKASSVDENGRITETSEDCTPPATTSQLPAIGGDISVWLTAAAVIIAVGLVLLGIKHSDKIGRLIDRLRGTS